MDTNLLDIQKLVDIFPASIRKWINGLDVDISNLVEIIADADRPVELRFLDGTYIESPLRLTERDINTICKDYRLGKPGVDNRFGMDGTLHRISCIRHRNGDIIGLTCRVGRSFTNGLSLIADLLDTGKSILLVGAPGRGKTSMLREACNYLSQTNRVVIVDTSNEIAGDSIVPHVSVGRSRRLMVPDDRDQSEVMIEACENHYPQTVVVDEISGQKEVVAARTIAERGVQLLATIHGNTIENVYRNYPDLLGRVKSSTMGDEYFRKHGVKERLERVFEPSFQIVVEIVNYDTIRIHSDCKRSIDLSLTGVELHPEVRRVIEGKVEVLSEEFFATTSRT